MSNFRDRRNHDSHAVTYVYFPFRCIRMVDLALQNLAYTRLA